MDLRTPGPRSPPWRGRVPPLRVLPHLVQELVVQGLMIHRFSQKCELVGVHPVQVLLDQIVHLALIAISFVKKGMLGEVHLLGSLEPFIQCTLDLGQEHQQEDEEET